LEYNNDLLIYQTEDGKIKIGVRLENETVWMTQKAIAELYQKSINTIKEHIKKFMPKENLKKTKLFSFLE